MSKLRPLAARCALVALISAGCGSNAPSETGTASSTGTAAAPGHQHGHGTKKATDQDKAVKFAECIREHGVPHFPDPDAKGDFVFGIDVSPAVWTKAVDACKDLAAAGRLEWKAEPEAAVGSPQVRRVHTRERREGLPGPRQRRPPRRHDPDPVLQRARWHDHPQRRDAEVRRGPGTGSWGPGVRRKRLGADGRGRPGRRRRHRRGGRAVRRRAGDRGRAGGVGEHRAGAGGQAVGRGLPGRDPDLPGAAGRLAVLGDQPRPRHLHRAARRWETGSAAAACCTGWTTGRCCCCAARSRPTARCTWATPVRTSVSSTATCTCAAPATPSPRRRRQALKALQRRKGVHVTGALALGDAVFLPEAVRIAKVTGQLGGTARPGAPGAERHLRHAPRAGEPRSVRSGSGQAGGSRADHAAGQHDGDGEGRRVRKGRRGPGRAGQQRRGRDHPHLHQPRRPAQGTRARQGAGRRGHHHRGRGQRAERPGHRAGRASPAAASRSRWCAPAGDATWSRCTSACSTPPTGASRSRATCAKATEWRCRRCERRGPGTRCA